MILSKICRIFDYFFCLRKWKWPRVKIRKFPIFSSRVKCFSMKNKLGDSVMVVNCIFLALRISINPNSYIMYQCIWGKYESSVTFLFFNLLYEFWWLAPNMFYNSALFFYLFAAIICKHYISRRRNLCVKTVVTHQRRRRRRHTIQL